MGFQDRPYYRDNRGGSFSVLNWLLSGSVPLGTWFGIRVKAHSSLVILAALVLLLPASLGGPWNAITAMVALFCIVVLHEFGHCFASRMVGGDPQEIMLSPLGGLAFVDAPKRPGAQLWAVAGGPLVNVIICAITGAALWYLQHHALPFNLLHDQVLNGLPAVFTIGYFLWWIYTLSWALLLFNLLPIFPLDGGQLLQSLLWFKYGYGKSMKFATVTGMIGGVIMAMVGIATRSWLLFFVAVSGVITCLSIWRQLKAAGPYELDEPDYSASLRYEPHHKHLTRRGMRRAQREAKRDSAEQAKIDMILSKVSAHGMHSLTWWEKRTLRRATERQRMREMQGYR